MITKINLTKITEATRAALQPLSANMGLSRDDIHKLKWDMIDIAKELCPTFTIDNDNKAVLNDLFNWCLMLQGRYNPHKGLLIQGNIGTGKTTMLEVIRRFCAKVRPKENGFPYSFRTTKASQVVADFNSKGYVGLETYIRTEHQAFDDLGTEPLRVNYYGTMICAMEYVILERYGRYGDFTHITTNLDFKELQTIYGDRFYDRCKEMFNIVEMNGPTRRMLV